MAKTDQWPNVTVDGVTVLSEMREINFLSDDFDITVDNNNDSLNVYVSDNLKGNAEANSIAYAVVFGGI